MEEGGRRLRRPIESSTPHAAAWVTRLASVWIVWAFILGFASSVTETEGWSLGYCGAAELWDGAYHALLTSVFVHVDVAHLAFNLYWLWTLGTVMEGTLGSTRYLAFFVLSAAASSGCQLACSGDTGIGASGVVYAIFGYMWIAKRRIRSFQIVDPRIVMLFIACLFLCILLTHFEVWSFGNAAHVSGLVFGAAVAGIYVLRKHIWLCRAAIGATLIMTLMSLTWCPWSTPWIYYRGYQALDAENYPRAVELFSEVIEDDSRNAYSWWNRGVAHLNLGNEAAAEADFARASEIDPDIDK